MIGLVYTDADGIEQGIIKAYSLDLAYGSEENDFKLTLPIDKQLDMRSFVYLDDTEWGGIVRGGKESTLDETPVYVATGKTWHGILSSTFICPASGEDYVTVSGEANAAIGRVLEHVGLSDVFDASTEGSGIEVSHRFERFADCYSGIRKMLNASGAKLKIDKQPGRKPALYAAPISSYIDTDEACRYGSKIEWGTPVNHLICLGNGDLAERTVIHLYADEDGNVSRTQTLFGLDEVQEVYDYSSAEDDELLEEGTKKLKELQEVEASELSLPEDAAFDVDDIVGTVSEASGRSITASVSKVIVKIDEDGYARVTNEIGKITASRSSGSSGGSSGGGVSYTAGDGISIVGGVISADVTEDDLDDKADAIHTHAWGDVTGKPDSYPPSDHDHDGRYYTKAQADAAINVAADGINLTVSEVKETADAAKSAIDVLRAALDGKAPSAHTHAAADIKSVNASAITGTIAAANLPSYVDDVLEYGSKASFPSAGEAGKIYVDTAANMTYRWSGSAYVEISASVALGETSSTAYRGDRGAAAYQHAVTNKGRAFGSGLYKITTNSEGHVTDASAVGKSDIVGLGIPAQDTVYTHPSYTARTGVPTANQTPAFGGSFSVSQPVSDATGHVTALNTRTVTIPSTVATQSAAGLMSAADKKKLDGIESGSTSITWQDVYPVGAYYFSSSPTSPASLFGGTWTAVTGKFLYMNAGTATGGSNTHTLTTEQMPNHTHLMVETVMLYNSGNGGVIYGGGTTSAVMRTNSGYSGTYGAGGGKAHNNMPAYQTVYAWRRTA